MEFINYKSICLTEILVQSNKKSIKCKIIGSREAYAKKVIKK